jgi:hemerythrin-like metal-binding protein
LSDYTRIHFASEEKLFAQYAYPETAEHTAEHARLIRELVDLRENPHVSSNLLSLEMMEFLRDWLSVHILEQDKAYSAFLISKGAK